MTNPTPPSGPSVTTVIRIAGAFDVLVGLGLLVFGMVGDQNNIFVLVGGALALSGLAIVAFAGVLGGGAKPKPGDRPERHEPPGNR